MDYFEDNSVSEFVCQICVNPFNTDDTLPKILPCGHTICESCISDIAAGSNSFSCPICSKNIVITELATNYSLLKLCEAFTNTPTNLKSHLTKMYINRISKNLLDVQFHINNAIKEATSLRTFGYENESFSQDLEDAKISVGDIEINIANLREKLFHSADPPEVNINIKTTTLIEIAERICKGEKIFTVAYVNDVKRFGKIFKRGNFLYVNALSDTEIPKGASLFWLCDLQRYHLESILPYVAVYDELSQQTTTYVFSDDLGECNQRMLDLFTGESGQLLNNCACFWKDKYSKLLIKTERNTYLNIKIRKTTDGINFSQRMEKDLPLSTEISVINQQRNPVSYNGTVGKFFKKNNLGFLFPKNGYGKTVKEHGIVLTVNWNKAEAQSWEQL